MNVNIDQFLDPNSEYLPSMIQGITQLSVNEENSYQAFIHFQL